MVVLSPGGYINSLPENRNSGYKKKRESRDMSGRMSRKEMKEEKDQRIR